MRLLFKRCMLILIFILLMPICLSNCGCQHNWDSATCDQPMICSLCGKTQGAPREHSWSIATCTTPKTCDFCKKTEGGVVEHTWMNATCISPQKCYYCNITTGSVSDHKWSTIGVCSLCDKKNYAPSNIIPTFRSILIEIADVLEGEMKYLLANGKKVGEIELVNGSYTKYNYPEQIASMADAFQASNSAQIKLLDRAIANCDNYYDLRTLKGVLLDMRYHYQCICDETLNMAGIDNSMIHYGEIIDYLNECVEILKAFYY